MNILYIVSNYTAGSNIVKGVQVVDTFKKNKAIAEITTQLPYDIKGSILVFVGSLSQSFNLNIETLRKLKAQKNILILDPVDSLCYTHLYSQYEIPLLKEVDGIIFPNTFAEQTYMEILNCKSVTIPHHYDVRLNHLNVNKEDEFKVCYAGSFYQDIYFEKRPQWLYTNFEGHTDKVLQDLIKAPIHFSHRSPGSIDFFFKPGTKLATASATNSILITSRDKSVIQILGDDYPFYIDEDINKTSALVEHIKTYQHRYKDLLTEVKNKLNIEVIYLDYLKFFHTFN